MAEYTRSMTMLNRSGDTTIAWTEEADEKMRKMIQKKLDEGYTFFIVRENDPDWMKRVKSADEIKNRSVLMLDDDMLEIFEGTDVGVVKKKNVVEVVTERVTRNIKEIMKSNTVAVRPIAGG